MPQSQPNERLPVWRTQFVRRERARAESVSSASSLSSSDTEEAEAQHHRSAAGNDVDSLSQKTPRIPPPREGPPAHDNVDGQLPQPDGFVGLAIILDLLYARLKSSSIHELSYHDRLNHHSLDTSILGQGASFTVLKRLGQCTELEDKDTNDDNTSSDGSSSATAKSSSSNSDAQDVGPVVMKVPRVSFDRNGNPHDVEQLKALLSEIQVMSALALQGHSNILRLLEIQWDHPKLDRERLGPTLYVEYAELGTLTDYLTLETPIAQQAIQNILLGVAHGLTALHQCGVIHGDVKLSNVLICKDKTGEIIAKLSDFGCSIIVANEFATEIRLRGRSPPWDAPEATGPISKMLLHKTDIYSFGLLYWRVMLGGADPFDLDQSSPKSMFAFDGDRDARIEAAQRMKAEQDMGEWMYQSVSKHRSSTQELESDMEVQLCVVGAATLTVDPCSRDLETVVEALNSSRETSPSTSQQRPMVPSKLQATKLSPGQAWDLKLCWVGSDSAVAGRFVEALQYLSSSSDKSKGHRMNASILLFRCYLEGFGVSSNPRLSMKHAIDAAEFGDPFAKSIIPGIHRIFGASVPAHLPLVDWLAEAIPHNTRNTIEDKFP